MPCTGIDPGYLHLEPHHAPIGSPRRELQIHQSSCAARLADPGTAEALLEGRGEAICGVGAVPATGSPAASARAIRSVPRCLGRGGRRRYRARGGARRGCSRNPGSWAAGRWRPQRPGGTARWVDRPGPGELPPRRWRDRCSAAGLRAVPRSGPSGRNRSPCRTPQHWKATVPRERWRSSRQTRARLHPWAMPC